MDTLPHTSSVPLSHLLKYPLCCALASGRLILAQKSYPMKEQHLEEITFIIDDEEGLQNS